MRQQSLLMLLFLFLLQQWKRKHRRRHMQLWTQMYPHPWQHISIDAQMGREHAAFTRTRSLHLQPWQSTGHSFRSVSHAVGRSVGQSAMRSSARFRSISREVAPSRILFRYSLPSRCGIYQIRHLLHTMHIDVIITYKVACIDHACKIMKNRLGNRILA